VGPMRRAVALGAMIAVSGCSETDTTATVSQPATPSSTLAPTNQPWFEDQAEKRGLVFTYESGQAAGSYQFPEIMGGGAALGDFDNDGDLDAYLVQGGGILADQRPPNQLFLNRGDGSFFEQADAGGAADTGFGMGAATGDYDNDGDLDLYVTNVGANKLYQNDGQAGFTDVTHTAGVGDDGFGASAAFLDLDNDGDLDLFVTNYIRWNPTVEQDCFSKPSGYSVADYCWPTAYEAPARDKLFSNNGDGSFTDVSDAAGLGLSFGNGLGVIGLDANNDGLTDVFVANDMSKNQLWLNQGDMRFRDEAMVMGCAVDGHGIPKSGMGVAAEDFDDDGDTDILVMNLASQTDSFFRNTGSYFEDATVAVGLATATRRYTRFGTALVDFDNDGFFDLYEANGAVSITRETGVGLQYAEPDMLLRGTSAYRFEVVVPAAGSTADIIATGRGVATGDIDNDGDVDLLVVNRDGPANLLMNQAPPDNGRVTFRLENAAGSDALGATLSAAVGDRRVQRRVRTSGSYLTASDPRIHLGLGTAASARDIEVRWLDGSVERFGDLSAGEAMVIRQGSSAR
jgi:enediyne biosynthesis protein E4